MQLRTCSTSGRIGRGRLRRASSCRIRVASFLWLAATTAAVFGFGSPLPAQQRIPGFSEAIDVRVVNLEVVVVDKKGERVSGLKPEDFELRVDGVPTPIEFWSEILENQVLGADSSVAPAGLSPGERLPTWFLVFVDDFFAVSQDRNRVLDSLAEQLAALGPSDRVALVSYDGKALSLLQGWSGDRRELENAISAAKRRPAFGEARIAELRSNDSDRSQRREMELFSTERLNRIGADYPDTALFQFQLNSVEVAYAQRLATQMKNSVLAAVSTLRSFAGPSGRKVMLLLSGGWPSSPAQYTVDDYRADVVDSEAAGLDFRIAGRGDLLRPLVDTANLLGYTLYAVDLPGQDRRFGLGAEESFGDFDRLAPDAAAGGSSGDREVLVHDSLQYLSASTGGRPLINAERDRVFSIVAEDTRSFYWLGFSPARKEDDQRHSVEILLPNHPDFKVRYRDGFVDLSRGAELDMIVESALLFGDPPTNEPVVLRFSRPKKRLGKMRSTLEIGVPIDRVTLLPTAGRYLGELEVRIVVMDKNGNRSDTSVETVRVDGASAPLPGQLFWYQTELAMKSRQHRIVVAVSDLLSGKMFSTSGEISVP